MTAAPFRFAVLSVINAPFLGLLLDAFLAAGRRPDAVILDSKSMSEADLRRFHDRTGGLIADRPPEFFEAAGIPFYFVRNHSSEACAALVRRCGFDLLINSDTPRILKPVLLSAPRLGVLNLHPGLLPDFRGCTCVEWAIHLDEPVGNSVHFMNAEIDRGRLVAAEPVALRRGDDYQTVRTRVYRHGADLMVRATAEIERAPERDFPEIPEGRYFSVIDEAKLEGVKAKLARGEYVHAV